MKKAARRIPVYVVVPPRTLLLDIAGPVEVLRRANQVQGDVVFEVSYVGPQRRVATSIGIELSHIAPLPSAISADAVVVLAGNVEIMLPVSSHPQNAEQKALDSVAENAIVDWLRATIEPVHTLITICSGALAAARAGLLDGHACTTHYLACDELASIAPSAKVLENRLYVEDHGRYTSAGVTAGIDLMLHFVGKLIDPWVAAEAARYLVVYLRRSGADPQLSPWLEGRNHMHPVVHRVQDAIAQDPAKDWTLKSLSRVAGASPRHLTRLFHEHAGMSIPDYRNRLRVGLAQELLSQTRLDMEHVAERAGFSSTRQLRRVWGRLHDSPPREARSVQKPS